MNPSPLFPRLTGSTVVHALVRRLSRGETIEDALESLWGAPFTEIAESARRHALLRLADRWDPEGFRLRGAALELGDEGTAPAPLDEFPSDYARVFLTYHRAKALEAERHFKEAARCYQEVTTNYSRFADYQDDAAFRRARALSSAGLRREAKAAVEAFLRDYSYAPASLRAQALRWQRELAKD